LFPEIICHDFLQTQLRAPEVYHSALIVAGKSKITSCKDLVNFVTLLLIWVCPWR